jgi:hypothetical protein
MPANLPCGMPGIGEEIEGAMQHAPQPERQSIGRQYRAPPRRRQENQSFGRISVFE